MLGTDYGFYVDLEDDTIIPEKNSNNKKKYMEELSIIDNYEIKYLENKYKYNYVETQEEWSFIDNIRCFWFIIQGLGQRYFKNGV